MKNTLEIDLHVQDYLGHAQQSEKSKRTVWKLLETGLSDPDISKYFFLKDQDLFFEREVFVIIGEKK